MNKVREMLGNTLIAWIEEWTTTNKAVDDILNNFNVSIKTTEGGGSVDEFDVISRPSHYTDGRKYEPRKVIHDWGLNFNLGNAVKYLSRAGRKGDKVEDLRKAIQYIEFEIEELEEKKDE